MRFLDGRRKMIDLHVHSNYSDGTNTPEELLQIAEQSGITALALTDHNTVKGVPDFLKAAEGHTVEAIGGAEFSTDWGKHELHIVGLFIDPAHFDLVEKFVAPMAQRKIQSNLDLEKRLQRAGYDVSIAEMLAAKPGEGQLNRADFAAELKRKGYMDFDEAFATVLSKTGGMYHQPARLDAMETIEFIRSIDAIPVFAHPYLSVAPELVEEFISQAVGRGLGAMEVYYSTYDKKTEKTAEETARRFGLAMSGGSDYHGSRKADTALGTGRDNLHIPESLLDALQQA